MLCSFFVGPPVLSRPFSFLYTSKFLFFKDKAEPNGYVILCIHPLAFYGPDIR